MHTVIAVFVYVGDEPVCFNAGKTRSNRSQRMRESRRILRILPVLLPDVADFPWNSRQNPQNLAKNLANILEESVTSAENPGKMVVVCLDE